MMTTMLSIPPSPVLRSSKILTSSLSLHPHLNACSDLKSSSVDEEGGITPLLSEGEVTPPPVSLQNEYTNTTTFLTSSSVVCYRGDETSSRTAQSFTESSSSSSSCEFGVFSSFSSAYVAMLPEESSTSSSLPVPSLDEGSKSYSPPTSSLESEEEEEVVSEEEPEEQEEEEEEEEEEMSEAEEEEISETEEEVSAAEFEMRRDATSSDGGVMTPQSIKNTLIISLEDADEEEEEEEEEEEDMRVSCLISDIRTFLGEDTEQEQEEESFPAFLEDSQPAFANNTHNQSAPSSDYQVQCSSPASSSPSLPSCVDPRISLPDHSNDASPSSSSLAPTTPSQPPSFDESSSQSSKGFTFDPVDSHTDADVYDTQTPPTFSFDESLFIFDWDDTLMPSTWIQLQNSSINGDCTLDENFRGLKEMTELSRKTLEAAAKLGSVIIITNADNGWVEMSCDRYMPNLQPYLKNIRVVSARSTYSCRGSSSPYVWKYFAFRDEVENHFKSKRASRRNIISLGDSSHERVALLNLRDEIQDCDVRLKSVKFIERPQIDELKQEHELLCLWLHSVMQTDQNLDLCIQIYSDGVNEAEKLPPCANEFNAVNEGLSHGPVVECEAMGDEAIAHTVPENQFSPIEVVLIEDVVS